MLATTPSTPQPHLITVKRFLENRDWPTESILRHFIFFNRYGFEDCCVRRIGRKVFIDIAAFDQWMIEQAK